MVKILSPSETFPAVEKVFFMLRNFEVTVTASNPFANAQVCAGGVPLTEVDSQMESRCCPGLYLAGELLDVDGRCGGYNLQWAWTSGYLAGQAAALSIRTERKNMIRIQQMKLKPGHTPEAVEEKAAKILRLARNRSLPAMW